MNALLEIKVNDNQEQAVSGRDLHMFLGIETRYDTWFNRMLQYGCLLYTSPSPRD